MLVGASPALAQAQADAAGETQLEEVVVTATRQAATVNSVPLSITAQTQRTLDQRGIRTVQDLQAQVPALRVTGATGSGTATIAIRGIVQQGQGAATTGLYLDETPLQRRNTGATAAANGSPLPALFDLDRVEVLRGPQGTLFGGSSQGGTIRFIQPNPSLTTYSVYGRSQLSSTHYGDESWEASLAVGGPIIQDKLGFRLAYSTLKEGGWIDLVNPVSRQETREDSNTTYRQSLRGALRWQVTDRLTAQASVYSGRTSSKDTSGAFSMPIDQQITVPRLCYNMNNVPVLFNYDNNGNYVGPRAGPITGRPFTAGERTTPQPTARGEAACAAARAAGQVTYETPAYTLGPYNLEPYQRIAAEVAVASSQLLVSSFDLNYDFENMSVKAITSYFQDESQVNSFQDFQVNRVQIGNAGNTGGPAVNAMIGNIIIPSGIGFPVLPGIGSDVHGPARFTSDNDRWGFVQELRFSSRADARPFSWVGGVYYSNIRSTTNARLFSESNRYSLAQYGITEVQRYTIASRESLPGVRDIFAEQYQLTKDVDIAAFGEANLWIIPDRLRLTAGVRWTRTTFSYDFTEVGQSVAIGPDSPFPDRREPTLANNGRFAGSITESPITPKFGAQYQINDTSLVYVQAARGFRPGGVNAPVPQAAAGDSLARNFQGATVFDLPRTYSSDTVWSYELGAKVRLFNRVQVNGALYRIDWSNTQFSVSIPQSGQSFMTNVSGARSQGAEVEVEARLLRGLTVYGTGGYNKAKYTEAFSARLGNGALIPTVLENQAFAQPKWTFSAGGRYDFAITDAVRAYARADWRYTSGYENAPFGTSNWNPDANVFPAFDITNMRFGVEYGDVDINLFVNNVFENKKANIGGGRSGCALPAAGGTEACSAFTAYQPFRTTNPGRPREIGVQIAFRH
jgi:outer membrane receptor protein involved in Fe transport